MAGMSLDGLVSGLDTTNLVKQLMQLERQPQVRLQTKLTRANSLVSTYQTLNTRVLSIKNAGEALLKPGGFQATRATSSVPAAATVTTTPSASPGSLTFAVTQLAAAHTTISAGSVTGLDGIAANGNLTLRVGDTDHLIDVGAEGTATLDQLVTLINKADAGVRATAVQVQPGTFRLQLAAAQPGEAAAFSLGPATGGDDGALAALRGTAEVGAEFTEVTKGQDAVITVGEGAGAYEVRRPSNVMADILPGVTINLLKADPATRVTVDVTTDVDAVTARVQALVEAVNGVFSNIKLNGSYNAETKSAGPLVGDATARGVQTALFRAMGTLGAGQALADVGLSVTRDGMLSLDKEAFAKAFAADPTKVTAFFAAEGGYASQLVDMAKSATDPHDPIKGSMGSITAAIRGRQDAVKGLTDQISAWDDRLSLREKALKRQYTSLESALGTLNNQSTWLAGQLGSLPRWNSNN
jgi:flagellar hook-associated protein 2